MSILPQEIVDMIFWINLQLLFVSLASSMDLDIDIHIGFECDSLSGKALNIIVVIFISEYSPHV